MTARRVLLCAALLAAASASAWGQLTINPATLGPFPVNQMIPAQQFSVAPPYQSDPISWSLSSGSLPPGLNFDPVKGAIPPGTPTQAGAFTFTVSAVDDQGPMPVMGSRQYTLYISLGSPLALTPLSNPPAAAGNFYLTLPFQVGGGVPGYTWAFQSAANADGLTINSSSGQVTGVPQNGGIVPITIVVTDASSATASATFNLNVLGIGTPSLPNGAIGTAYSQTLAVAPGGTGPFSWTVTGASLPPPGLTLSPQGQITGTPTTPGTYPFQVQVTDAGTDLSSFKTLSITIPATLTVQPTSLPNGIINSAYSQTLMAAGSPGPFTWSLSSGALPPSLNITPQGLISGTPTQLGAFPFQVSVIDPLAHLSAIQSLTITVTTALTVTTTSLPNGTVNVNYSQVVQATGGTPPYRWSATGLPAVLTMDPVTGTLSGLPAAAGTSTISVTVTDATQANAGARLSLTIGGPAISPATLPSGFVNVPYPATPLAVAGENIVTWAVTAGTLPAGLRLDATTGTISGTPTAAGSSTFAITATPGALVAVLPPVVQQFTMVINTVTITGLPSIGVAATQPTATVSLSGGPYPLAITGTMTLTFAPATGATQPYDAKFANGSGTTATFTIPVNATPASIPVMIGTVAGTITITTSLQDSNGTALTPPAPVVITVDPTPPVITKITIGTVANGGFSISVTGRSTPRDMTSALFHFTSPTNQTLTSTDVTVPLTSAFTTWYGSATSIPFGSTFVMTVQFSFTGPPGTTVPFTAVSVTLTNSKGTSNAVNQNP